MGGGRRCSSAAAVAALRASDEAAHLAIEALDWRLGLAAGGALRVAGPALVGGLSALPPDARDRLGGAVQGWIVHHPGLVQHAVNGGGGLLTGLAPLPCLVPDNRSATALLATAYDDGTAVTTRRPDLGVPAGRRQPGSVAGLVEHLSEVAALSPDPDSPDNGTIEVQSLDPGTDHARHIVYLPGTDDLATLPWTQDDDVRDLGSDLRSAAGEPTAYQRGILDAMRQAGHRRRTSPCCSSATRSAGWRRRRWPAGTRASRSPTWSRPGRRPRRSTASPTASTCCRSSTAATSYPCSTGPTTRDTVEQTTVTFDDGGRPGGRGQARLRPLRRRRGRGRRLGRPVARRSRSRRPACTTAGFLGPART